MKVYTRTGDHGATALASGGRVVKNHPRVEAYGCVDELNALLGLLRTEPLPAGVAEQLVRIQGALLAIGGELADPEGRFPADPQDHDTGPLEAWIDEMDSGLDELRSFILPGGTRAAAIAHLARTVCRRAERRVVAVAGAEGSSPAGLAFLNRLSDALFMLARHSNAELGVGDERWPQQ